MSEAITCVNCGSTVSTPFCGSCGQKNPPKKLNLITLYTDFQSRVYGFDGMFPRTLRDLTIAPGSVAKVFVHGNRVRYVGPAGYFFLALTMFLIVTQLLGIDFYQYSSDSSPFVGNQSKQEQRLAAEFTGFITEHMRVFSFLQIPIITALAWMFFRRSGYNYLEHAVFVFYVTGHVMWLSILGIVIYAVFGVSGNMLQLVVYWAFFAFGCTTFYAGSKVKSAIKGFFAVMISFLIFAFMFAIAGIIYVLTNPALIQEIKNTPR